MRTKRNGANGGLVYSTEHGTMCPACNQPLQQCICHQSRPVVSRDGIVRVERETKGRKGSGVTIVNGAPLDAAQLTELCTRLKKRCGSGGTVKNGVIEIQGDHREVILEELTKQGWRVKRVGG